VHLMVAGTVIEDGVRVWNDIMSQVDYVVVWGQGVRGSTPAGRGQRGQKNSRLKLGGGIKFRVELRLQRS